MFSLTKQQKLLNASDFNLVFDNPPFKVSHKHLLILAKPNSQNVARLGLVVAKKNIKLAVQRNRFKRLIRESFRLKQQQLVGLDIVVLARRDFDTLDNSTATKIFDGLWNKLIRKHTRS